MIRWMGSSLLGGGGGGGGYEDMVVFECVTVAGEGCRCLEGCYGDVLRDCVLQQGYDQRLCVCGCVFLWNVAVDCVTAADFVFSNRKVTAEMPLPASCGGRCSVGSVPV